MFCLAKIVRFGDHFGRKDNSKTFTKLENLLQKIASITGVNDLANINKDLQNVTQKQKINCNSLKT